MIDVEQLRKAHGEVVAVDGVSFAAWPREIFGLLGPNGAGKTTAIGCISSLLTPALGRVRVMGRYLAREGAAARRPYCSGARGGDGPQSGANTLETGRKLRGGRGIPIGVNLNAVGGTHRRASPLTPPADPSATRPTRRWGPPRATVCFTTTRCLARHPTPRYNAHRLDGAAVQFNSFLAYRLRERGFRAAPVALSVASGRLRTL